MGLFDIIRYPISMPPAAEELADVPPHIFQVWSKVHFGGLSPAHAAIVLDLFWQDDRNSETVMKMVGNLRRLIAEME